MNQSDEVLFDEMLFILIIFLLFAVGFGCLYYGGGALP